MTRTTERGIWIGVVLLLVLIGAVLFLGPAGRMVAMCQQMMEGGMIQQGSAPPDRPSTP